MVAAHQDGRYSRQSRFAPIGATGQERLRDARVVVVGCGALGCASVELLARSGVGEITVIDRDLVELSNLQRQLLFDEADAAAGTPKALAAAAAVARINSEIRVLPVVADVSVDNVEQLLAGAQVVLDGTDNLETRYLINDACIKHGIPWIYGGAIGSTGMSMTVIPGETACFRCLFPHPPAPGTVATCDVAGVLGAAVVTVSAYRWTQAAKLLVGEREHLCAGLMAFDLWADEHAQSEAVPRRPDCPCCGQHRFEFLQAHSTSQTVSLCGRDAVQVSPGRGGRLDLAGLGRRLDGVGTVTATDHFLRLALPGYELTVFSDGRAIIKGTDDPATARSLYSRYVGA